MTRTTFDQILVVSGTLEEVGHDGNVSAALRRRFFTDRVAVYFRVGNAVRLWLGPAGAPDEQRPIAHENVPAEVRVKLFPAPMPAVAADASERDVMGDAPPPLPEFEHPSHEVAH